MTRPTATTWLIPAGLGLATILIYSLFLGSAPIYLHETEVLFALHARALATTLHDLNGRFLPLYVQMPSIGENVWFQPQLVYFTALFLKVLPLTEWAIRLPSVVIGALDVILIYFVAKKFFDREAIAIVAASLLALMPAHVIHSRLAMDYIYPLPFVLAWLLCLLCFVERPRVWLIFAGTSFLGFGLFSYVASLIMMPLYLGLTWFVLLADARGLRLQGSQGSQGRAGVATYVIALIGFAWPALLAVPWLIAHPVYADTVGRYTFVRTIRDSLHFFALTERAALYWSFFGPGYLFMTGGLNVMDSTRRIGVFLLPMAVLLPIGINQIVNARRTPLSIVVLVGFVSAPLAAMLPAEAYAIDRELELLPFAALIAAFGVEWLIVSHVRWRRLAGAAVLAGMVIQFGFFYVDYLTDYGVRSSGQFGRNVRGMIEQIIARDRERAVPAVHLSREIPYVDAYWTLYLAKNGREDLLERTVYFDHDKLNVQTLPARAVVLTNFGEPQGEALLSSGELRRVSVMTEPNGVHAFSLFER